MAILKVIIRKMLNNRWLTGSLFLGLVISVSLVSSIPTYTSSVLQKMLVKELEEYQVKNNEFPGMFTFTDTFSKSVVENPVESYKEVTKINEEITQNAGLPILTSVKMLYTSPQKVVFEEEARRNSEQKAGRIVTLSDIDNHITITDGRLPSKKIVDGIIEVLVPDIALLERDMVLDHIFIVGEEEQQFRIKPVGTFTAKSNQDPYWSIPPEVFNKDFIVYEEIFEEEIFRNHENLLGIARFSTAFDYHAIKEENIPKLLSLENSVKTEINEIKKNSLIINFPIKGILKSYEKLEKQVTMMLWSLNVPVLVMLAIYLFMVSRLIVQRQLNEIAVFASRGAKRVQILLIYFIEVVILGFVAFLIGPYIGLFFSKIVGASNGFLEFVQRTKLPAEVIPKSFLYGLFAVVASVFMIMIPVYHASKQSIVNHKQNLAKIVTNQKWYGIFIDVALLAIAIYGYSSFNRRQQELLVMTGDTSELSVDPLLFFVPAIFIIGMGLLILRIYPWILKAIYKVGERFWTVSLYSTFLQVSRSVKQYHFLMLFLIMTIGIGVYSASSARTINTNLEEQLRYKNGAEVTVDVRWYSNNPAAMPGGGPGGGEAAPVEVDPNAIIKEIVYSEPPFEPFTKLDNVEQATKVFKKESITVLSKSSSYYGAELMAIEPKQFGETAWFKPSLLPHHWYEYLNLIAQEPSAVLISTSLAESLGVGQGDYLTLSWDGSDKGEFVVYGIFDYWPTFNPIEKKEGVNTDPVFIVANLPYVQNMMGLEPYQVWMKPAPNTMRASLYDQMKELDIPIVRMDDVVPKITELKNSAFLLGLNGTMTLGFLISVMITFIGFLLYWILTIKSRTLQYGIYRAMGIPMRKLISILVWEQIMTSGIACLLGIIVGGITSKLFVPLFKLSLNPTELVPPFTVVFDPSDEFKIYSFIAFMLAIGLTILVIFLRKIKIHQAIKLGED